ncbi:MAG: hypothetical protein IJG51_10220 [Synergistaceae bacterium]|nr:hypothetical protein [Synergistaceae bacterium]
MAVFNSLQAAKGFINQQANAYVQHLLSLSPNLGSVPFAWHVNQGGLMSMLNYYGYTVSDSYVVQALNDAVKAGYITMNGVGGVMITPLGYANIGQW